MATTVTRLDSVCGTSQQQWVRSEPWHSRRVRPRPAYPVWICTWASGVGQSNADVSADDLAVPSFDKKDMGWKVFVGGRFLSFVRRRARLHRFRQAQWQRCSISSTRAWRVSACSTFPFRCRSWMFTRRPAWRGSSSDPERSTAQHQGHQVRLRCRSAAQVRLVRDSRRVRAVQGRGHQAFDAVGRLFQVLPVIAGERVPP